MSNKEIAVLIWALVAAVAALASLRVDWPASVIFSALGVGALIIAVRTERL